MALLHKFVTFDLENRRYALPLESVVRVVRAVDVAPLPQAPETVAGVINVAGEVAPVFDLRRRFGLPPREISPEDHFILARTGGRTVALIVDSASGLMECAETGVSPASEWMPAEGQIEGAVIQEDGLVLVENLDRFLSPPEEECLGAALESLRNQ